MQKVLSKMKIITYHKITPEYWRPVFGVPKIDSRQAGMTVTLACPESKPVASYSLVIT